jgi:hypothetical protein
MCKPKSEGGQRCFSHMNRKWSEAVVREEAAMTRAAGIKEETKDVRPRSERRALRAKAESEAWHAHEGMVQAGYGLVATPAGRAQVEQWAAEAAKANDPTRAGMFDHILREGDRLARVSKDTSRSSGSGRPTYLAPGFFTTGVVAGF